VKRKYTHNLLQNGAFLELIAQTGCLGPVSDMQ